MAEEQVEPRPVNFRQWFPWTEIFTGFKVALDPKKLLLAAAGILFMAAWWWLMATIFYAPRHKPEWPKDYPVADYKGEDEHTRKNNAWARFREDRKMWNLLHEAAGTQPVWTDAGDLAETPDQHQAIKDDIEAGRRPVQLKPYGKMVLWPWFEPRGENPYLLIAGRAGPAADNTARIVPTERGQFFSWFITEEVPVLIEPLVKFTRPVAFLLRPVVGFWNAIYFLLVLVGTVAIWGLFGGAITRIAAVQITRKERIGMSEAIRFTLSRWISFFSAPLIPLLIVLGFTLILAIFGLFHLIGGFGDIVVDGLFWFIPLGIGLCMAIVLIGLVGWPMMYATISTEGSDSFDALSRSYSYVFQSPWNYLWYCVVAIAYGMVLVFFVGLVGSMTVYLAKWGVSQTPFVRMTNREPEFLFVYAPTSFGWRDLLLRGSPAEVNGVIQDQAYANYLSTFKVYNHAGAYMVAAWLYLFFLLILGFGYSFFWTASTIIYLLMRQKVDDTDMNEVYLEEEELETPYAPLPTETSPATSRGGPTLTMVDPPALKTNTPSEGDRNETTQAPPSGPAPGGGL
jgi:hypothetical protein